MENTAKTTKVLDWGLRLVPAAILAMAAPPKFGANPEAVAMFSQLGAEPAGRLATGGFELLAVLLLLIPGTVVYGGLLAAGLMSGALVAHFTVLGVAPGGDVSMFAMALVTFGTALTLVWRRRTQVPLLGELVGPRESAAR